MKLLLSVLLTMITLLACQSNNKSHREENPLIRKFKPLLHGVWIPEGYAQEIEKTKSPLQSSGKLSYISEFSIDTSGISTDSIDVGVSYGNHEGGDFMLYFKQGQTPHALATSLNNYDEKNGFYELGYVLSNPDTNLVLYSYDQHKKLLFKETYIKVPKITFGSDAAEGLQLMVNKKLFAGDYIVTGPAGNEVRVGLTNEGIITGFGNFKTYYIITDFVADPEYISDEICFDIQTKNQKCYGYKIVADTINLFEPAQRDQDTLFTPGPVVYKFIRRH